MAWPARTARVHLARTAGLALSAGLITMVIEAPAFAQRSVLDVQRDWVLANAGRPAFDANGNAVILYPRLSLAWQVTGGIVTDCGRMVVAGDGQSLELAWQESGRESLPDDPSAVYKPGPDFHPLALAFEAFLDRPLVAAVGPLPPGTVVEASGVVRLPGGTGASSEQTSRLSWVAIADRVELLGQVPGLSLLSAYELQRATGP